MTRLHQTNISNVTSARQSMVFSSKNTKREVGSSTKLKKIVRTLIFLVGGFTVMFVIGFVQTSTTGGSFYDPAGYYNP